jgi:hypothetical protein
MIMNNAIDHMGTLAPSAWVVWKYEGERSSKGKIPKVPYIAKNYTLIPARPKDKARPNDSATWGTLANALEVYNAGGFAGVGVMFLGGVITGVDIDNCIDSDTQTIHPDALAIIQSIGSYTEISPSGKGVKIFCIGDTHTYQATDSRGFEIEVYPPSSARYFTVTGKHYEGTPLEIRKGRKVNDALGALEATYSPHHARRISDTYTRPTTPPAKMREKYIDQRSSEGKRRTNYHRTQWEAVLQRAKETITSAGDGTKHNVRCAQSYRVGLFVGAYDYLGIDLQIDDTAVITALYDANRPTANAQKEYRAIVASYEDGVSVGSASPSNIHGFTYPSDTPQSTAIDYDYLDTLEAQQHTPNTANEAPPKGKGFLGRLRTLAELNRGAIAGEYVKPRPIIAIRGSDDDALLRTFCTYIVSGDAKLGKSTFVLHLADCVGIGASHILGSPDIYAPAVGRVLLLDLEQSVSTTAPRALAMGASSENVEVLTSKDWRELERQNGNMEADTLLRACITEYLTTHPDTALVIVDNLGVIEPELKEGNRGIAERRWIEKYNLLAETYGACIVLIEHNNKPNVQDSDYTVQSRMRGTAQKQAAPTGGTFVLSMTQKQDSDKGEIVLTILPRDDAKHKLYLKRDTTLNHHTLSISLETIAHNATTPAHKKVFEAIERNVSKTGDIEKDTGLSKSAVQKALDTLQRAGAIISPAKGVYTLPPARLTLAPAPLNAQQQALLIDATPTANNAPTAPQTLGDIQNYIAGIVGRVGGAGGALYRDIHFTYAQEAGMSIDHAGDVVTSALEALERAGVVNYSFVTSTYKITQTPASTRAITKQEAVQKAKGEV